MPKSKKFINKKNAVTFHLVHRSQQDPLITDENAPQHVLVPTASGQSKNEDNRKEEQRKFGVFYDDDYDYLQHLKDSNKTTVEWEKVETIKKNDNETKENSNLKLPSSVFASEFEEEVGLLNKAAPQGLRLDLDPDLVAAMDEDFDYDNPSNQLEDNFFELANTETEDIDEENNSENNYDSESYDEYDDHDHLETRSRFSEYSESCSVIFRNNRLQTLDEKFEQMFADYDDIEIGALDGEDIHGTLSDKEALKLINISILKKGQFEKPENDITLKLAEKIMEEDESDEEMETITIEEEEKWDCESFLSTYSNQYNHPKIIQTPKSYNNKIKLSKMGIPMDTLGNGCAKLDQKALKQLNRSTGQDDDENMKDERETIRSTLSLLSIRDKNETHEEKHQRKQQLKKFRQERRVMRKLNSEAYKEEAKRISSNKIQNRMSKIL